MRMVLLHECPRAPAKLRTYMRVPADNFKHDLVTCVTVLADSADRRHGSTCHDDADSASRRCSCALLRVGPSHSRCCIAAVALA